MNIILKKRHIFGFTLLGVFIAAIIIGGLILLAVYSQAVTLTFSVNETGMLLNGSLYQGETFLGEVKDGKITLVWQDFYPGEIRFNLNYSGKEGSFFDNLTAESLEKGEQSFYLEQDSLVDLTKDLSDYNFDQEGVLIFNKINEQRAFNGASQLKQDIELEKIAKTLASKVSNKKLEPFEITASLVNQELTKKGLLFVRTNAFWTDYTVSSKMDISNQFIESILSDKYWTQELFFEDFDDIAVVSSCNEEKRCITLVVLSSNQLSFKANLRDNYMQNYDLYYYLSYYGATLPSEAKVNIYINSSDNADFYLVKDKVAFDRLLNGDLGSPIFKLSNKRSLDQDFTISEGNNLVISANYNNVDYTLIVSRKS